MNFLKYLFIFIFILLMSCSDNNNHPMTKLDKKVSANFNLQKIDGTFVMLEELRGSYILVNFWATWCKPCVREIPSLNNLSKIYSKNDNFKVIAINIGQKKDIVNNFLQKIGGVDFLILLDEEMNLPEWDVQAIPTTFIVDKEGFIIFSAQGEREWDSEEFTQFIDSLLE